jgi:hypothetical protein
MQKQPERILFENLSVTSAENGYYIVCETQTDTISLVVTSYRQLLKSLKSLETRLDTQGVIHEQ